MNKALERKKGETDNVNALHMTILPMIESERGEEARGGTVKEKGEG